jgi:hypothetical protein
MSADPVAALLSDPRFRGKPITWGVTSEGYDAVRRAWLTHVHAEEVLFKPFAEDEFKTQMEVMLSVFTDDCVMELVPAAARWDGRAQATEFYRIFLGAFEGMKWVPQALVIGPQGVLDVVNMTGKLVKKFAGLDQVGAQVHLQWVIYFPWVPDQGKFKGEVIYSIRQL